MRYDVNDCQLYWKLVVAPSVPVSCERKRRGLKLSRNNCIKQPIGIAAQSRKLSIFATFPPPPARPVSSPSRHPCHCYLSPDNYASNNQRYIRRSLGLPAADPRVHSKNSRVISAANRIIAITTQSHGTRNSAGLSLIVYTRACREQSICRLLRSLAFRERHVSRHTCRLAVGSCLMRVLRVKACEAPRSRLISSGRFLSTFVDALGLLLSSPPLLLSKRSPSRARANRISFSLVSDPLPLLSWSPFPRLFPCRTFWTAQRRSSCSTPLSCSYFVSRRCVLSRSSSFYAATFSPPLSCYSFFPARPPQGFFLCFAPTVAVARPRLHLAFIQITRTVFYERPSER